MIVALAVVLGGAYFVGTKGFHYLKDHLSSAEDYPGPGHGQVLFQVKSGDTVSEIGRELKAQGVVASVQAFMNASDGKTGIQVGYYQLKKRMAAEDAFKVLINPRHIVTTAVTIPEGLRVSDTVAILAAKTKFSDRAVRGRAAGHRGARASAVRQGQPGGLPLPVDVRVRAEGEARRHAQGHGRPVAAGSRRGRARWPARRRRARRPAS